MAVSKRWGHRRKWGQESRVGGLSSRSCDHQVRPFALQFLGELSLIDADPYLKYLPSVIAGAAFHLALYTVTGQSWVCTASSCDFRACAGEVPCLSRCADLGRLFNTVSARLLGRKLCFHLDLNSVLKEPWPSNWLQGK